MDMHGSYDPILVALSVGVAIFASFTALNLAGRLLVADQHARRWWLAAAAVALGGGIWSMHFVGMLAFNMPVPASYDVRLTILSLTLPIVVVGAGLLAVSRFGNRLLPLLGAGVLAGIGIVTMHYSGMAAMRMTGVTTSYEPMLVGASVAIAVIAATAAFWLAFRTQHTWERLIAAVVMGFAIAGMHYTGMAAAVFTMDGHAPAVTAPVIQPGILAVSVVSVASILLLLALLTAFFDRKLATLTAREAETLKQSEERHRALIRNASDIVAILNAEGIFTYEGSSAWHILGYRTEDIVGCPFSHLVEPNEIGNVERFINSLLPDKGAKGTMEIKAQHADGSWRDFDVTAKNLLHEPSIGGVVVNLRDITERKRLMAELEKLSETDPLTGALNRRGFLKIAEREFERVRRNGQPLTVVMIDIDHFKGVNDTYGHAAGDMVLAMIAEQCRSHMRNTDLLARFGGEEFVILLIETSIDAAHDIASRLSRAIAASRIRTIKGEVAVTASFGLATVDPNSLDLETAIRFADEALYEAKNAGRNCVKVRRLAG